MTFISIIIPFNTEKRYLRDCLDSISEEKIDDAEIILILNGVNDNIHGFLEKYNSSEQSLIYIGRSWCCKS